MSPWEAEPGPVGSCIPLGRGDQRLLHFALMTRMRGLGIDSPHGSKWTPASRHLFQRPLRPRWVWRRVSSPGSPLRHSNLLLSFSNGRSVLMVIVICFSPAPGSRESNPHPIVLSFVIIYQTPSSTKHPTLRARPLCIPSPHSA